MWGPAFALDPDKNENPRTDHLPKISTWLHFISADLALVIAPRVQPGFQSADGALSIAPRPPSWLPIRRRGAPHRAKASTCNLASYPPAERSSTRQDPNRASYRPTERSSSRHRTYGSTWLHICRQGARHRAKTSTLLRARRQSTLHRAKLRAGQFSPTWLHTRRRSALHRVGTPTRPHTRRRSALHRVGTPNWLGLDLGLAASVGAGEYILSTFSRQKKLSLLGLLAKIKV